MGKGECESIRADARWAGAGVQRIRQHIARWAAAAVFALAAAVALIAVVPEVGGPPSSASAAGYGWEEAQPETWAIDDEFAARPAAYTLFGDGDFGGWRIGQAFRGNHFYGGGFAFRLRKNVDSPPLRGLCL